MGDLEYFVRMFRKECELYRSKDRIRNIEEYKDKSNNYLRMHGCPARRRKNEIHKKQIVIEVFRFQIDSEMPDWFNKRRITNEIITYDDGTCDIKTLEGVMKANKGDYVILGVQGEFYPCKPDIFKQTYDRVVEEIG